MVAAGGSSGNKKLAEALLSSASQVCPRVLFPLVYSCFYGTGVIKLFYHHYAHIPGRDFFVYNQMQI
jgi:hypothetical protein